MSLTKLTNKYNISIWSFTHANLVSYPTTQPHHTSSSTNEDHHHTPLAYQQLDSAVFHHDSPTAASYLHLNDPGTPGSLSPDFAVDHSCGRTRQYRTRLRGSRRWLLTRCDGWILDCGSDAWMGRGILGVSDGCCRGRCSGLCLLCGMICSHLSIRGDVLSHPHCACAHQTCVFVPIPPWMSEFYMCRHGNSSDKPYLRTLHS